MNLPKKVTDALQVIDFWITEQENELEGKQPSETRCDLLSDLKDNLE